MLTRRRFLHHASSAAVASTLGGRLFAQAGQSVLVKTPLGALRGERLGDVNVFRGVPFAQPPVGPLRFQPPLAPIPWTTARDATRFAAAAMQPDRGEFAQSEDCLYLNVWAPAAPGTYPVLVWVHGGGFTGGRSFDALSDGSHFAREGVICVNVAYRLGVLGFLDVSPLLGAAYAGSADNGLRDIMAALTWVQGNIRSFGGDPQRVTLGGESAGAKLTDVLMGVPSAQPLFQSMISESGGAERVFPAAKAEAVGSDFGAAWTATGQALSELKSAPAAALIGAQQTFIKSYPLHFPLRMELGASLLPASPLVQIRAGSTRGKRLLLGTNLDESALFIGPHPQHDPGAEDLGNLPVARFAAIAERYKTLYPNMSAELRRVRSLTAEEYWIPSLRVADAHVRSGGTAYVYRFDFTHEPGRQAGLAFHAAELAFVWDALSRAQALEPDAVALAQTIHAAWVAFLKGSAPAAATLPRWPAYTPETRPTMLLNRVSRVENAPAEAEFKLWQGTLDG